MIKNNKKTREGFSLIEIMVVVTIIALLGGLVATGLMGALAETNIKMARTHITQYNSDLAIYYTHKKKYPSQADGLKALLMPVGLAQKPVRKSLVKDPWGEHYIYIAPSGKQKEPIVRTYGKDHAKGGVGEDADIDTETMLQNGDEKE